MGQERVGRAEKIPEGFWEEVSLWGQPRLSGEPRLLCSVVTELSASPAHRRPTLIPTSGTEAVTVLKVAAPGAFDFPVQGDLRGSSPALL